MKYIWILIFPILLVSKNINIESMRQLSENKNKYTVKKKKLRPQKSLKQLMEIKKLSREKSSFKKNHIVKPTQLKLYDLKKSIEKQGISSDKKKKLKRKKGYRK